MSKGWEVKELAAVSAINYGYTDSASSEPVGPRFLRITDIQDDHVDWEKVPYCRIESADLPKYRLATGDIVFARTGATTGKSFLVDDPPDAVFASYLIRLRLLDKKLMPEFVSLFFQTAGYWQSIKDGSSGSAQGGFNATKLGALNIPIPPLREQKRIVGLLDEAFAVIATAKANAEKNLQNASALFESNLHAVFTQRSKGWTEKPLVDLCIVDWGNTDLTKSSYVEGGKFLAVSAAGCDGRIGHKEHAKYTPVLSAIGAQCGRMFLPEEDFTAIKNTITLTPIGGKSTGRFLYRLLTHVDLPKRGAAQPFIAKGDILAFKVNVPDSLTVQQELEESLSEMEVETQRLASIYERKLATLDALKKSLLHQAFTGEL